MKVTGDLTITAKNAHEYTDLESVGGSLDVRAHFTAPLLTNVGGGLGVHAEFAALALTKVGAGLYVNADFAAPTLTTVGRLLYANSDFVTPALTKVGGALYINAPFTAPVLTNIEDEETTKFSYMLGLTYTVLLTDNYVRIGCKRHTRDEWAAFTDSEIDAMDTDALSFWREHKDAILNKNT